MLSKISNKPQYFFMAMMLSALVSCGSIADSLSPTATALIFDLMPIDAAAVSGRNSGYSLSVSEPRAATILDSDKILVRPSPIEIQYYGDMEWADRVPKLVHRRVVQAFEDSGRLRSVAPRSDGFDAKYDLLVEIRDFQVEPSLRENSGVAKPIRVKVTFFAKLVSERSARVLRSTKITQYVEIEAENRPNVAMAFNTAFTQATVALVNWTLR
ncbi:MAG: ABC-type transport auxiliary lipoprotein family protein [Hyphomicrobiales bacterium]